MFRGDRNGGWEVVLTSDRGSFSEYSRSNALGYFACMPSRLVPRFFMDYLFNPPLTALPSGEARLAPYALRKVEAALLTSGITSVAVVPPEELARAITPRTRILGITAHDPFGLSPVSTKLTMLFGGGPAWNATYFEELGDQIRQIRTHQRLAVIAGGPGIWQMTYQRPDWIDTVFHGEAEIDFPILARSILSGAPPPATVKGRSAVLAEIPTIVKPARLGEVQVTRGCPRGCEFCSITPERYRTFPLESILAEVRLNVAAGEQSVELLTDDILLYGASKLHPNHDAVVRLFQEVRKLASGQILFPHVSAPAVREAPKTMREIGDIAGYHDDPGESPVVGLETGSVRVFAKYMPAKSFPWKPADWPATILEATQILNDSGIWPCYTMTIGFPDETDADVDDSIDLVQSIIDHGLKCWIFPLPVIPISSSRLRGNRFPELERLPSRYWDLLYIAWQRDLKIARELQPVFTSRMRNPIARRIMEVLTERTTQSVDRIFRELQATRGHKSYDFTPYHFDTTLGAMKSVYVLTRSALVGVT